MNSTDLLAWLQAWYLQQCNGTWEHGHGIHIDTLDNPGWSLDVWVEGTPLEGRVCELSVQRPNEHDWVHVRCHGKTFKARGGPSNLGEMLNAFRRFAEGQSLLSDTEVNRMDRLTEFEPTPRRIHDDEAAIIEAMLAGTEYASKFVPLVRSLTVYEMNDGGMGSLRLLSDQPRDQRFGKEIATTNYIDNDGVPVSLSINIDRNGELFELDVWKVDYTPLKRWPKPEDLFSAPMNKPAT